jgi:hypothetical protein
MHLHNVEQRKNQDLSIKEGAKKTSEEPRPSKTSNYGKKKGPSKTKGRCITEQGHLK